MNESVSTVPEPSLQDIPSLEHLVPSAATSAAKKSLIAENRAAIFGGAYEPAAVTCLLATLEACDLRELRDELHVALPDSVPAAAGRPLCRRAASNITALAEDCWALGYSASQGILTQRAASTTLKPAGRDPLPPPSEMSRPTPAGPTFDPGSIRTALEALVSTQLRMEREIQELNTQRTSQEAKIVRLQHLEEETIRLREECATRDSRIAHLELAVSNALAQIDSLTSCGALPASAPDLPNSRNESATGRAEANRGPAARHAVHEPVPTSARDTTAVDSGASDIARQIAAGLDLRALGQSIAAALQWRVDDSDCESDIVPQETGAKSRHDGSPRREGNPRSAIPQPTRPHESVTAYESDHVTGVGAASDLVLPVGARPAVPHVKFSLEGFRADITDRDARSLVWSVVRNLHDFHRLPNRAANPQTKAYLIEVDAEDAVCVMDATKWPAGLTVRRRPFPAGGRRQKRQFRAPPPSTASLRRQGAESVAARGHETQGEQTGGAWPGAEHASYAACVRGNTASVPRSPRPRGGPYLPTSDAGRRPAQPHRESMHNGASSRENTYNGATHTGDEHDQGAWQTAGRRRRGGWRRAPPVGPTYGQHNYWGHLESEQTW